MITEVLSTGKEHARTAKELAAYFGCNIRNITKAIERERRQGKPICAEMQGRTPGYYLAETPEELETYCRRLHHRAAELYKTRQSLLSALPLMAQQEGN